MSSSDSLSDAMFKTKHRQLLNSPQDKDRIRLIKNIADQFVLTPKQAIELCNTCSYFAQTVEACAIVQFRTTNEDEFIHMALVSLVPWDNYVS